MVETVVIGCLVFVAVFGFSYAFLMPVLSGEMKSEKRLALYSQSNKAIAATRELSLRKGKVNDVISDLEKAHEYRQNPPLKIRLSQAGVSITVIQYVLISIFLGFAVFFLCFVVLRTNLFVTIGLALFFGFAVPRLILNYLLNRRVKKFIEELPNAVDIIVRGVKAGLTLNEAMGIVSRESKEPVASEFNLVLELQQLGLPLAEAVMKLPERMPIPESNFFAIVVAIQSRAGGSLSEVLTNLANVLRDRRKMKNRITALSQEAKTSAWIIGSLPVLLGGFLVYASPQHMDLLFRTKTGYFLLICCVVSMMLGAFIMHKMINFKI